MYGILAIGYGDWPIIHQIAWLLGKLMNGIYIFMDSVFGVQNIGVCIILFTIIIYTLMIPLTIKQQKWSKMSAVMTPEIQKIQKKYQGKNDQASMLKQQDEMHAIYDKYGTSPTGGCLPMLATMPVLFALYPVIRDIPRYVTSVKNVYVPLVDQIMATSGFQKIMEGIGSAKPVLMSASKYDYSQADTLLTVLYNFQESTWQTLMEKMPSVASLAESTMNQISHLNSFCGVNIGEAPMTMFNQSLHNGSIVGMIGAAIIPVAAGLAQFVSVKLQPTAASQGNDQMANSMKTMTYTMPLISVFMGFSLPAGLGLYWAVSAIVRCVQQVGINKYLDKKSVDELIEENRKKTAKKREKKGTAASTINRMATTSTRSVEKKSTMTDQERKEKLEKAANMSKNAKAGSLTAKANMVSQFNNANSSKNEENKDK